MTTQTFRHLMIDLETLGTAHHAPILSIGAVFFDPDTGALGPEFYQAVDVSSAFDFGRPEGETFRWWMHQPDAARMAVLAGIASLPDVLTAFRLFCGKAPIVWGNGATFDITVLEYAYQTATGTAPPWSFRDVRDCRTLKDVGAPLGVETSMPERWGTKHHALDDARWQAKWVSEIWRKLRALATPAIPEEEGAAR